MNEFLLTRVDLGYSKLTMKYQFSYPWSNRNTFYFQFSIYFLSAKLNLRIMKKFTGLSGDQDEYFTRGRQCTIILNRDWKSAQSDLSKTPISISLTTVLLTNVTNVNSRIEKMKKRAQSARAIEYTDCISAEGVRPLTMTIV